MQQSNVKMKSGNINSMLFGVYGEIKTGKSTFALTFPTPMVYINFDQGFHRASWRFPNYNVYQLELYEAMETVLTTTKADVYLRTYRLPFRFPGLKASGYTEMYDKLLLPDMMSVYNSSVIRTIVIDTGSLLWTFICEAHLERLNQFKPRENLMPLDYRRPNTDMRTIIGTARHVDKNLCIVHHVGGVYKAQTGRGGQAVEMRVGDTWAGWKEMGSLVDVVGRMYDTEVITAPNGTPMTQRTKPYMIVEKCGLTLDIEGARANQPTYDNVLEGIYQYRQTNI